MTNPNKMDQEPDGDYRWSDEDLQLKKIKGEYKQENLKSLEESIEKPENFDDIKPISTNTKDSINENDKNLEQKKLKKEPKNLEKEEQLTPKNLEKEEQGPKLDKQSAQEKLEKEEQGPKLDKQSAQEKLEKEEQETKEEPEESEKPKRSAVTKSDIKKIIVLLKQMADGILELQGLLPYIYDDKGREPTRRGRTHIYKFLNYYDVVNNIRIASNEDPNDFDSPVYNIERIFTVLERYSDIIHVSNGGTNPLFVIISHEGTTNFSKESVIFPGEVKDFYNVFELRLRSPQAGLQYRVTEYDIMSVSQTSLIPTELASLHDVPLPDKDKDWLPEDIVPIISPTTLRIEVAVSIDGIFRAAITNRGNTQIVDFNTTSGPELVEDGVYVFELLVHEGDSVNFRFSENHGKIKILRVQEIDASAA